MILPVFIIFIAFCQVQLVHLSACPACPHRQVIIKALLLIQMCPAAVAVPFDIREAVLEILLIPIKRIGIRLMMEQVIQFVLQLSGLADLPSDRQECAVIQADDTANFIAQKASRQQPQIGIAQSMANSSVFRS